MKTYLFPAYMSLTIAAGIALAYGDVPPPQTVKPGYVACTTAYMLDQYQQSPHRRQIGMMLQDQCLPTDRLADYEYLVLNDGRVRVMLPDDQYADLYMPVEAVRAVEVSGG
jgi:hypothetical protein